MTTAASKRIVVKASAARTPEVFHAERMEYVEQLLAKWAAWMRIPAGVRGYPSASLVVQGGWHSKTLDEIGEEVDAQLVRALDTIISEELPVIERLAVHNVWLGAVYRFREPQDVVYERAKLSVIRGLKRRGFWTGE